MDSLLERIRSMLRGEIPELDPAQHRAIERRLDDQAHRIRIARIDAGLPVDRRQHFAARHPGRRASDGHA